MIFKTNKNGITIGGKTVDEISEDFDKLSNYISEKTSKISSDLSAVQDKINSKNSPSTWSYNELSDSNISNFDEENYSIADKIREQNEYNELLKSENSSIEAAIELSKHRVQNYDETLPKLTEINNEYEKQRQLELEDKYNSTIKERNNEYDKYLSNLNTEVEESKKVQDSIKNISPDTLGELGYKQKGYLKEIREEQQQFSDALTRVNTASVESLLPKKEDVKGYYDELLTEQREFQSQLNAIEITPIDSLKRDQYSEILSEQTDGQMALNLSASEYNDTLSTQNDLSNQRVLTLSEETDGQMALVMAENEGVSAKQKDIAETTSQIAAKEALIEASNKELLSNVNEKLAKTGATSATEELTIAKLREIAASNEEGSVLAKETLEMLGLGEASKATSIALKGLAMVGNMIAAWAIAEVLQLVVKGLDELANSVDNCKGRVDNLMSSYQTALDTANSNASRVEELASDYEKLSKGVNNLGENVSLTSEEYEQYNSLVSEIADMFPTLIQGYNDQGIAILNLKGNIEGLRDAYKEAQTEAYNTLITSGENGDGNDIIKQWEDIHDPGFFAGLFDLGSADVGGKISVSDALAQLEEIQKLTAEEYRNIENIAAAGSHKEIESLTDIQKEIGYGSYIGKALGIDENVTDEEFEKAKKQAKTLVQTYNAEIESALSDVETLANAYLMTNDDYSKLTDNSKTAASLLVNNLTKDIASDFSSKENVGSWVDSIVSKLQNNPKLSNAINGLFTSDLSNMSVDEAKAVVDQYINTIAKILKEDPVDIKVRLGFDDYNDDDIAPLKKKVQGFLKDEFDDKVGELSLDDLQVASKFEIPEGTLLSWDELKQKIEETKNAVSEEETTISLADINKTKSGIGGLFDKYEQNEGYLTQDEVASVLETNPEYIQYLVKVGDQYKLNEQALNDWNEANKEQEQEINNQMGGNDYLGNYSSLLDSIQDNASHPNGGVGNTNIGSQLDDLINKNKEWNTSLQNGEITTAQYFQNMSNAITDSGLEDALHSLNGTFDDSTDYIEETVSVLTTQLSDGLTQSTKRFEEGQTSVKDYIQEINAGSDAEKKLLASTYNLDISQETGKASLDGLSDSALEAAQSYNSLVDSQNALASTSSFVDVLSQNADFLSQYTDEAGNLMDSIFDDSRFNDYVSNMSNSIVDFANQNADTMDQTASWLADTAGISVEQASSIIAQGGDAVQGAVGNSLSGVQSMTSYAMSQVGSATSNAASAVGNVLTSLGNMISNFSYKITAKPFIQGKSKMAWDPKKGLDVSLPTFGFDISGSGGKSVSAFATSIKNAGSAISKYGASQSASAAFNNINSYKPKNTLSANKPSSYRPTYTPKSSGKSGSGGSGGSGGKNSGGDAEKQNEEYLDKFMAYQKALLEAGKITYQQYSQYVSDELERMYKNGKISASKYYSAVKDMIDEQKSIYDAALKGVTKLLDDEIDKWKDKIDVIEKNNDKLNEQKDKYDSILSAIQKVYDDEIKKANKKKDSIQDVIDAMSDENDEYERQKKLQEAIYNLNKANSQKTKYLLKDGQFVYSTDNSAIRDAQDSLHDAQYDVDVANLKKQQDDIDNYIDTLNEFKDKWNEISDAFSEAQDAMNLKQYLGSEYQRIILSNNLADIENFKNQYVAVESQINSNEQLKTSYEEKVDYYNNLKQQWEDCTSKYDDEKNKLYASQILGANWEAEVLSGRQQTLANFTSEYEKLCQRQADATVNAYNTEVQAAKNAAAGIASVSSSVASSGGGSSSGGSSGGSSSSTHKVTYDKNNNPNKPALKSNDYWTYEKLSKKGYSTSGQASSHISDYASKGANGFTQIGNKYFIVKWIANAGTPANASKAKNKLEKDNPKKIGKYGYAKRYHKGLELGKIEALPKDKAFDLVQDVGTNGLEADEVPIIAQKGEAVLTEEQIENLAKTLHLVPVQNEIMEKMNKISLGNLPMNTPKMNFDASKVGQNVTRNNFAPSVTLNLNCPNVSSVSDAKAITNVVDKQLNKFANDFYQASLHYVNKK